MQLTRMKSNVDQQQTCCSQCVYSIHRNANLNKCTQTVSMLVHASFCSRRSFVSCNQVAGMEALVSLNVIPHAEELELVLQRRAALY